MVEAEHFQKRILYTTCAHEEAGLHSFKHTERDLMDEERDIESQASTYSPLCLSWWMMRNLWQQGVSEERHLRVNIVDTVLLEDGHLTCWYFTSAKSGLVLKVSEAN